MKVNVYDKKLKSSENKLEISESVWATPYNPDLVSQAVYVYSSNQRTANAAAKTRGQVSGGGRKPWRQKGTGRARHGSIRSPLWVGGGVTFTPAGRNWKKSLNRKMKLKALSTVLSERLRNDELMFVEMSGADRKVFDTDDTYLLVTDSDKLRLKLRNMANVQVSSSKGLNSVIAMRAKKVCFDVESLENFEKRFDK